LLAAARLSLPTVAIFQTDVPGYTDRYGLGFLAGVAWNWVRDIHSLATLTLAPSTSTRDQLRDHGIPRVEIWGRGVDTVRFDPAKRDPALHQQWAPQGQNLIGYMGRLAPEKQISDLTVLSDLPDSRLVIIGDGPSQRSLQAQLPQAHFTGKLFGEDLAQALASLDLFIHPGELDTFGQTIQEALASGLPVLAPHRGGPVDLIQSGQTGYLYPPGDLDQLRQLASQLLADPVRRQAFALAARAFVKQRSWTVICDQLLDYYHQAIRPWASGEIEPDPR
jgi:phosphatidylinositol alpha 1,6-mannosyltransferase